MKIKRSLVFGAALLALSTLNLQLSTCFAQGTAFTYQGRLNDGSVPAHGNYDFRFKLFVDPFGNTQAGGTLLTNGIPLTNGLFTVEIDFGAGIFNGSNCWLEVGVRTNGGGGYTDLNPLQAVTPTPYAIFAATASNVSGTISSANLTGAYGGAVAFNNSSNSFSGSFSGNGADMTNVDAAALAGLGAVNFWQTGGNGGTTAGVNFLGTTDNQPLEVRVSNTRVLRLEPDGRGLNAGNLVGGHPENQIQQPGSGGDVVAGGGFGGGGGNIIYSNSAGVFIGAGSGNRVGPNALDSTILGGLGHTVQSSDSVVGGGYNNMIQSNANSSFIGGGGLNTIETNAQYSTIGGGNYNTIQPNTSYATVGGGFNNTIQTNADTATIDGGHDNTIQSAPYSKIGGGGFNIIQLNAYDSAIGGGGYNTIQSDAHSSAIGGGSVNTIQTNSPYSMIGGGYVNTIQTNSSYSAIGGGYANTIQFNVSYATIGGGGENTIQTNAAYSTIGGGIVNTIQTNAQSSTIGGGYNNTIQSNAIYAVIPGGYGNVAAGYSSFAAGQQAQALHPGAFVWADSQFAVFASTSNDQFNVRAKGGVRFVTGGAGLALDGQPVFTGNNGAGLTNVNALTLGGVGATAFWQTTGNAGTTAGPNYLGTTDNQPLEIHVNGVRALRIEPASTPSLVGGFFQNSANGFAAAAIAGGGASGSPNSILGNYGFIGAGQGAQAGSFSAIVDGVNNVSPGQFSFIGSGLANTNLANYSFIGGGTNNSSSGLLSTILGGANNSIQASGYSMIGGGVHNRISAGAEGATIGGGEFNADGAFDGTLGGGHNNFIGVVSTAMIGGGDSNTNNGDDAVISGGFANFASGIYSTIPGGVLNVANGSSSFAAGDQAQALHNGTFVWADSTGTPFGSTAANQFLIRATGGVGIGTGNPQGSLHVYSANNPTVVRIQSTGTPGFGRLEFVSNPQGDANEWRPAFIQSLDAGSFTGGLGFYVNGTGTGNKFATNEVMRIQNGRVGIGTNNPSALLQVGSATCNGTTWANASDRNAKENFKAVDTQEVLAKVAALPVTRWNYKADKSSEHLGPMAQDFQAVFHLDGADDKHITTVDEEGVALAAIQGLNQKVESENSALRVENTALKQRLEVLEKIVLKQK